MCSGTCACGGGFIDGFNDMIRWLGFHREGERERESFNVRVNKNFTQN